MLSMHDEGLYAIRALKAGASGYITKQSAPSELMAAINQVAWGRKYLDDEPGRGHGRQLRR